MHPLQSAPARSQAYCRITAREKLGCGVRRAKNRRLSPAFLERGCCQETDWRLGCAFEAAQGPVCARTSCVRELKHLRVSKTDRAEENLSFDRIILATGSRPSIIPALKLDTPRVMDSTAA